MCHLDTGGRDTCYQKQVALETSTVKHGVEYGTQGIQRKPPPCVLVTATVIGEDPFQVSVDLLDAREDGFCPQCPLTPTLISAAITLAYSLPKLAYASSLAPLNVFTLFFKGPTDVFKQTLLKSDYFQKGGHDAEKSKG